MDAIELLVDGHDTVRVLAERFVEARDADDTAAMRHTMDRICAELMIHHEVDEQFLYPAVRDLDDDELGEFLARSLEEHHIQRWLIRSIQASESTEDELISTAIVLVESVEQHAGDEESELFPVLREFMSQDQLNELGEQLETVIRAHRSCGALAAAVPAAVPTPARPVA